MMHSLSLFALYHEFTHSVGFTCQKVILVNLIQAGINISRQNFKNIIYNQPVVISVNSENWDHYPHQQSTSSTENPDTWEPLPIRSSQSANHDVLVVGFGTESPSGSCPGSPTDPSSGKHYYIINWIIIFCYRIKSIRPK